MWRSTWSFVTIQFCNPKHFYYFSPVNIEPEMYIVHCSPVPPCERVQGLQNGTLSLYFLTTVRSILVGLDFKSWFRTFTVIRIPSQSFKSVSSPGSVKLPPCGQHLINLELDDKQTLASSSWVQFQFPVIMNSVFSRLATCFVFLTQTSCSFHFELKQAGLILPYDIWGAVFYVEEPGIYIAHTNKIEEDRMEPFVWFYFRSVRCS